MPRIEDSITLGKTNIRISPMGIGTSSWGDRMLWGYERTYGYEDIEAAFQISLDLGVTFVDTAEVYASGQSERIIGELHKSLSAKLIVGTKFMPFPWRLRKNSLRKAVHKSLMRLQMEQVDLYQIHWPVPPVSIETWAEALANVVDRGLTRAVGVSNFSEEQMRRAYSVLARRGIPLASNQISFSLIDRKAELNGLLQACQELDITVIAYSPLGQGILTGKYSPEKPPPGFRGRRYSRSMLEKLQPLHRRMNDIGKEHGGKSLSQVALNWCMCKGAIPIAGVKNAEQAVDNCGAMDWRLSQTEVDLLDQFSADL